MFLASFWGIILGIALGITLGVHFILSMELISQLEKELLEVAPVCTYCQRSEEEARCDMLVDAKCRRDICVECFRKRKGENCPVCTKKIADHTRNRNVYREKQLNDASKAYTREMKIRTNEAWESVDTNLVNLLAYFHNHPTAIPRKYEEYEREIKKIQGIRQKKQSLLAGVGDTQKGAYKKMETNGGDGSEPCGYRPSFQKGFQLILNAFIH